jgi:hypothetical protein
MRDKGRRHSFRVPTTFLYALLCCILCMPFLLCGLGWFSWHIRQENILLRENVQRFEDGFQKAQKTAERLENLEELLSEDAVPGRDVLARGLAASQEASSPPRQDPPDDEDAAPAPTAATQDVFPALDADYIKVDNVQARVLTESRLRVALDLRNTDNQKIAAGRVSVQLLTVDGARHDLVFAPANATDFRISRFKRTIMFARLSPQVNTTNAQIILEVRKDDNTVVYRNIFSVER